MVKSFVNPILTLDYMINEDENKYFDRKSVKIKPSDIASLISAFANAEGGTIVIGISDKNRKLEGLNEIDGDKINNFINAPRDCCKPMPIYEEEFLEVINEKGQTDKILLLHIHASIDQIIGTSNDSTFLRIGDKTRELKGIDLRNLEYSKGTRHYEDECNMDAQITDLDDMLINEYKKRIGADELSTKQALQSRGFLKINGDKVYLTNAAVLLFAKNITQFYPNCRIRFIRYAGNLEQVGTSINIIKDVSIEYSILSIIEKAKDFVASQLREFTALNPDTGKFQIVPEYPEFAWLEGIVNAVTHREYGMMGSYINVVMFDDRLEIQSPGRFPNLITIDNIRETRYSRNPRISRVLTEFGWVRELNEGVERIYSDMEKFFLGEPVYSEPEQSVKLLLKNNIVMRTIRQSVRIEKKIGSDNWMDLDDLERKILVYMSAQRQVSRVDLEKLTEKSGRTINKKLNQLIEKEIIRRNGSKNDPKQTYEIV